FFGGLWLTVKKAVTSRRPALWFVASLVARIGITLLGFYYVSSGGWINMLICLAGFILARYLIVNYIKSAGEGTVQINKENGT
ncbi:MAG: ATP synthase subunit I, partial [Cyclobacteriaceae bacterium]